MKVIHFIVEHWKIIPIVSIITWSLKYIITQNKSFPKLIREFQEKLPPSNKKDQTIDSKNLFTVIDTSTHIISIDPNEIDVFYNRLEKFNFKFVIFHKHYKNLIKNLKRFDPKSENGNFDSIMIQRIIEAENLEFSEILKRKIKIFLLKIKYRIVRRNR